MQLDTRFNKIDLNPGWKFKLGEDPKAWYKGFDDQAWKCVDVPHDWAVEHPFSTSHSSGTGYLPAGTGWYRKSFFLPEEYRAGKVYVTFDGIYNNSMVWCNSYYLGKRPNGYTRIVYDITDFACFGDAPNVLAVKVNHTEAADSRWYTGSGITRKVTVTVKDAIHICNDGIFISTESIAADRAFISVETSLSNETVTDLKLTVRHTFYDGDKPVVGCQRSYDAAGLGKINCRQFLDVHQPQLWSPETPKLYTCITELLREEEVIDCEKTVIGIRSFFFDPNRGFFLNEKNTKLKGVCIHHDAGCLGAAVTKSVWKRRLDALKDMGCNAIRMCHNPHMPELYDLCDEMGFLVIDEAFDEWEGVKNKWVQGHNVYPPAHFGYYEDFPKWHEADLSEMVLRDRNHPSVILWSIGNEIDYPNDPYCHPLFQTVTGNNDKNKPVTERIFDPNRPNAERLVTIAKELASIVKGFDATRPVTAALAFPELSNITGLSDCVDIVGYNYKEDLYEADHQKYPGKVILGTENNKGLKEWNAVVDHEFISGQFLWTGIDFLGETQGWPSHGSHSGLLDVAGFKKPAFFFRKSLWCEEPMAELFTAPPEQNREVYLNSPLVRPVWNGVPGEEVCVICFTNCAQAELWVNGRSTGKKIKNGNTDSFLVWKVPYEKGEVLVTASDANGGLCENSLSTTGPASEIRLCCEDGPVKRDTSDILHVVATITDSEGKPVQPADNEIHVTVEQAALKGLESGNLEDTTPYACTYRKACNGKLLLYIKPHQREKTVTVTAAAEGLKTAVLKIPGAVTEA